MSYDASHRRPPRQERWPNATPQEGWPAYVGGDTDQAWGATGAFAGARSGHAATNGYATNGYGTNGTSGGYGGTGYYRDAWDGYPEAGGGDGYPGGGGGYPGNAGYASTAEVYPGAADGFDGGYDRYGGGYDGYGGGAWDEVQGGAVTRWDGNGYDAPQAGYLDEYAEPGPGTGSGPLLIAPDTIGERGWLRDRDESPRGDRDRSGLIIGAVMGFLAAAVAIGVSTFAAAFVRPQASPIIAVGGAFIDRTPSALKNFAVQHFGENDKTVLLGGMYVTIALIAMAIGCLARRNVTVGVAGIAAFGLFGAFVAITRPESHVTDVMPSVIGGIAGVAALLWLARTAAPVAPVRAPARTASRQGHASSHRRVR